MNKGKLTAKRLEKRLGWFAKACRLGDIDSCETVAAARADGEICEGDSCVPVAKDIKEAQRLNRRVCDDLGGLGGCVALLNSAAGYAQKAQAGDKACAMGLGRVCYKTGVLHLEAKQDNKAANAFEKGCDFEDGSACGGLAVAFAYGEGREKSVSQAQAAMKRGCHHFNGWSCYHLTLSPFRAPSLTDIKAKELRKKACSSGYMDACNP